MALGLARISQSLVTARPANRFDQDQSESRQANPPFLTQDGGGVDHTESVRRYPETDSVFGAACTRIAAQPVCEIKDPVRQQAGN